MGLWPVAARRQASDVQALVRRRMSGAVGQMSGPSGVALGWLLFPRAGFLGAMPDVRLLMWRWMFGWSPDVRTLILSGRLLVQHLRLHMRRMSCHCSFSNIVFFRCCFLASLADGVVVP